MDEPTLTSQVDEADASVEKSDLNEVLDSTIGESETEKPMEVDEVEPSTSAEPEVTVDAVESVEEPVEATPEVEKDDTGKTDVSISEVASDEIQNETVEQINLDKAESPSDETLNETAQSETVDTLDFTEKSINISQLNVEHHDDDSNDAFNALKESEVDALQEPKEELEEPKEEEETQKEPEAETSVTEDPDISEVTEPVEASENAEKPEAEPETPMETEETVNQDEKVDESTAAAEESGEESRETGTETADFDNLMNADDSDMGPPADVDKPQSEETEGKFQQT